MCWNGFGPPQRDEDEYQDSEGDLEFLPDADEWQEGWPGEKQAGPEYWLNKDQDEEGGS